MEQARKMEFYLTPDGDILVSETGWDPRPFAEKDNELVRYVNELIRQQYPEAFEALCKEYSAYIFNKWHYEYRIASRFIRCNFGKFDGLTFDIDDGVMHLEDVWCPQRKECPLANVVCRPKRYNLTYHEAEIARMMSEGKTYKEISERLGISHSTIKNILQRVKEKLHLQSSKDITRMFVVTL